MGKICEVCGRPIKTGRKYCFEHRNTISAFSRERGIIDQEISRFDKQRRNLGKSLGVLLVILLLSIFIVGGIFNNLWLAGFLAVLFFGGFIFLLIWLIKKNSQESQELDEHLKNEIRRKRKYDSWKQRIIEEA